MPDLDRLQRILGVAQTALHQGELYLAAYADPPHPHPTLRRIYRAETTRYINLTRQAIETLVDELTLDLPDSPRRRPKTTHELH